MSKKTFISIRQEQIGGEAAFTVRGSTSLPPGNISACYLSQYNFVYAQGNSIRKIPINSSDLSVTGEEAFATLSGDVVDLVAGRGCVVAGGGQELLVRSLVGGEEERLTLPHGIVDLAIKDHTVAVLLLVSATESEVRKYQIQRDAQDNCHLLATDQGRIEKANALAILPNDLLVISTSADSAVLENFSRVFTMQAPGSRILVDEELGTYMIAIQNNRDLHLLTSSNGRQFQPQHTLTSGVDHLGFTQTLAVTLSDLDDLKNYSSSGAQQGDVNLGTIQCLHGQPI